MMSRNKGKGKAGTLLILVIVFGIILLNALADEGMTRIADLEKEELDDDDDKALKEYYGQVFGFIGPDTRFNNMAVKENIAIINVTIDGRDRRIITKLAQGVVLPRISDKLVAALLEVNNATVFDYLKILGKTIFSAVTGYGQRDFYSVESTEARYTDEGFSRLVDGKANVSINPVLRELISSYNAYLSAEGLTQGIYVSEKSSSYFVVKSVNSRSNVGFSWMLRGIKKGEGGKLESAYAKKLGIDITAVINPENGTTAVRINGLDKILELVGKYNNEIINDSIINNNSINNNNETNQNDPGNGPGIKLITGNLVDEFGLETDIGKILSDEPAELHAIGDGSQDITANGNADNNQNSNNGDSNEINNNLINDNTTDQNNISSTDQTLLNETSEINETSDSVLEFTLFSIDEELIVNEISIVTGLMAGDVRKLVTFVYAEPVGFEDEAIEAVQLPDFIEKVNGSVIVRLG